MQKSAPPFPWLKLTFLFGGLLAWTALIKLLLLSLLTYFMISSSTRIEEISEVYSNNLLTFHAIALALAFLLLRSLFPLVPFLSRTLDLSSKSTPQAWTELFGGLFLGFSLILALTLAGQYRYVFFVPQVENALEVAAAFVIRALAIIVLVYVEEYFFRDRLLRVLKRSLPRPVSLAVTTVLYCAFKVFQFSLGIMQIFTMVLLSVYLSLRCWEEPNQAFTKNTAFLAGLLVGLHAIFGVPIFGNEFSGLILFKYQGPIDLSLSLSPLQFWTERLSIYFTGGAGGLLASFLLQAILLIRILLRLLPKKKLPTPALPSL